MNGAGGLCLHVAADGGVGGGQTLDAMVDAVPHRVRGGEQRHREDRVELAALGSAGLAVDRELAIAVAASARLDDRAGLRARLPHDVRPDGRASDADLILAGYRAWGIDVAAALLGDFAYVLWDGRRRLVHAARDPMAMRPLYYRQEPGGRFLAGSEVKQVLAVPDVPRAVDETAVAALLANHHGLLGSTAYAGVAQLPPAHSLAAIDGRVQVWRHWDVDPDRRIRLGSEQAYAEMLRDLVVEAVRARLPHATAGIMLSGGVDSGAVASVAGWLGQRGAGPALRAYTWALADLVPECDERHLSRHVVEHYGLAQVDVPVLGAHPLAGHPAHGPDEDEPWTGVYQPLIDRTVELAAADGVEVLLGGDRGDLVAGDWGMRPADWLVRGELALVTACLREQVAVTGQTLPTALWRSLLRPGLAGLRRALRRSPTARGGIPQWVSPDLARRTGLADLVRTDHPDLPGTDPGAAQRYRYVFTGMHMRGAVWSERTYARHGVGFADPWSDRRLAEFAVAVPQTVLNRPYAYDKRLVREAMTGVMPEPLRLGARKIVPQPLYDRALSELATATVWDLLTKMRTAERGWVLEPELRRTFSLYLQGFPLPAAFWNALGVEAWERLF